MKWAAAESDLGSRAEIGVESRHIRGRLGLPRCHGTNNGDRWGRNGAARIGGSVSRGRETLHTSVHEIRYRAAGSFRE